MIYLFLIFISCKKKKIKYSFITSLDKNSHEDFIMGHRKSKLFDEQKVMKNYMELTYNQIQYICHRTNLVDKEVCRRHAQFLMITNDGHMTKEQFTTILQVIWPTGNVRNFADYLFNLW